MGFNNNNVINTDFGKIKGMNPSCWVPIDTTDSRLGVIPGYLAYCS